MTRNSEPSSSASADIGPISAPLRSAGQQVLGDWILDVVHGAVGGGIILQFRRDRDGARLPIEVRPRGQRQSLVSTAVGDVSYLATTGIDDREAHRTTLAIAELLDRGALPILRFFPHLAMPGGAPDGPEGESARRQYAALLGAQLAETRLLGEGTTAAPFLPDVRRTLYFDALGIAEFLAPEVEIDGTPVAGYVLRAIYPPATARRQALDYGRFVLEFEAAADAGDGAPVVRVQLGASPSDRPGFGRVGPLTLSFLGYEGHPDEVPLELSALSSWLLALVRLKHGTSLNVHVPTSADEVRALSIPFGRQAPAPRPTAEDTRTDGGAPADATVERGAPRALNLAIDAPCRQQCAFCSVQRYVTPRDGGDEELGRILQDLRTARERGIREVRLNGIDPLAFSRVLDVVRAVTELGFAELSVYSPCRRFADDAFRREFLRGAPARVLITVPLYGVSAAVHDAVTSAPGAHAEVMRAIGGLRRDMRSGELRLSTVVVRRNLHEVLDIARLAHSFGVQLDARLPYPMRQTLDDPYADAALRETEIIAHLLDAARSAATDADLALARQLLRDVVPHPCLLFRAEQRSGLPVFPAMHLRERPLLPGTEYRSSDFAHTGDAQPQGDAFAPAVVACPHASRCALATTCPGEQFSVYDQLYGVEELSPVRPGELYMQPPHPDQRHDGDDSPAL